MSHRISTQEFSQRFRVAYVCLQELKIAGTTDFFKIASLLVGRIEVIEIVYNRKFRTLAEKSFGDVRADKARPASQKHVPRLFRSISLVCGGRIS